MRLVQLDPDSDTPLAFELEPSEDQVTLGLAGFAHLGVPAEFLTGHGQCLFRFDDPGWSVCDLGSPRATLLNGVSLRDNKSWVRLKDGDRLTCGSLVLRVLDPEYP